jgi:hypothetical protein
MLAEGRLNPRPASYDRLILPVPFDAVSFPAGRAGLLPRLNLDATI